MAGNESGQCGTSLGSVLLQGLARYMDAINPEADTPHRVALVIHGGGVLLHAVLLRMSQSDDAVMQRMGQCFLDMVRLDRHGRIAGWTPTMTWTLKEAREISRPWYVPPRRLRIAARPITRRRPRLERH